MKVAFILLALVGVVGIANAQSTWSMTTAPYPATTGSGYQPWYPSPGCLSDCPVCTEEACCTFDCPIGFQCFFQANSQYGTGASCMTPDGLSMASALMCKMSSCANCDPRKLTCGLSNRTCGEDIYTFPCPYNY